MTRVLAILLALTAAAFAATVTLECQPSPGATMYLWYAQATPKWELLSVTDAPQTIVTIDRSRILAVAVRGVGTEESPLSDAITATPATFTLHHSFDLLTWTPVATLPIVGDGKAGYWKATINPQTP